jgi:flagellar motor protein MotB
MQRRRGLISQPAPSNSTHAKSATPQKHERSGLNSSDEEHSSDSEASSATISDDEDRKPEENVSEDVDKKEYSSPPAEGQVTEAAEAKPQSGQANKKTRRDFSDETRWQKMKVVGSEKEVMVDLTRIQKYVDYDSTTVQSFQSEVQSAKGSFRQQAMADYSDL